MGGTLFIFFLAIVHVSLLRSANSDVVRLPVIYQPLSQYAAMVGIGSEVRNYSLMIDTASHLTWLQCEGADPPFHQEMPLYPFESSATFRRVNCSEYPRCGGGCPGSCTYEETYKDGSVTSGFIAEEEFTLGPDSEKTKLIFGCGTSQRNFRFGYWKGKSNVEHNNIAGILGLGPGNGSFLSQLGIDERKKFAYCLQTSNENIQATYLRFGADATFREGQAISTTPLQSDADYSLYSLNLDNISVGDTIVNLGEGGTIIDSGSAVSFIHTDYYDDFANVVIDYFEDKFKDDKFIDLEGKVDFETCFTLPSGFSDFPPITLHFEGADYVMSDYRANFVKVDADNHCLAFKRIYEDTAPAFILGALQQNNKRILYNLEEETLSFATENCVAGA